MVTAATAVPPLAYDDEGYPSDSHAADHREHYQYHEWANDAHERAHEEGFSSRGEHRAYHCWLRGQHEDFHKVIQTPDTTTMAMVTIMVGIVSGGGMGTAEGTKDRKPINPKVNIKHSEKTCRR
jgi:hypothetical protein